MRALTAVTPPLGADDGVMPNEGEAARGTENDRTPDDRRDAGSRILLRATTLSSFFKLFKLGG